MAHEDLVKVVTPDWVTESIAAEARQKEEIYHPRLIEIPKPPSPPKPVSPPKTQPMEVVI